MFRDLEEQEPYAMPNVEFEYYCYRCGSKNALTLQCPSAPQYQIQDLRCKGCGDATKVLLSHCPNCSRYVYWITDFDLPAIVGGFARYMVQNMQAMIDRAAQQGATIGIDTPDRYPIRSSCACGTKFAVEIRIPDLD
jgi:hypothetical protein